MIQFNFNLLALPVAQAAPLQEGEAEAAGGALLQETQVESHEIMEAGTGTETGAHTEAEEHSQGLSVQPTTLIAHGLNFVLLLVVLNLILYKPLTKLLSEREKKIREGVENAEKAEVMINEAGMTKANILKQANMESQSLMEKARQSGESLKVGILEEAHKEADHIVKAGQHAVEMERAKTLEELQSKAVDLIVGAAEKILRKKMDSQADAQLIQESIQQYR